MLVMIVFTFMTIGLLKVVTLEAILLTSVNVLNLEKILQPQIVIQLIILDLVKFAKKDM